MQEDIRLLVIFHVNFPYHESERLQRFVVLYVAL